MSSATTFFDFEVKKTATKKKGEAAADWEKRDLAGEPFPLSQLKGKVVLVVNTASKCGFTPQFEGLEKLYKDLKAKHPSDVEFLGFPCNQFMNQEESTNEGSQAFCMKNYGVSFPILAQTKVNGAEADPVWEFMKGEKPGLLGLQRVKWNFEKFLVGRDGHVVQRWASSTKPESLKAPIEAALEKKK